MSEQLNQNVQSQVPPPVPTNGAGAVENAAIQAAANLAADPAARFNVPGGDPLYTNKSKMWKFKAPRKGADGKPPTDNFGNPIPTRAPVSVTFPIPTWKGIQTFLNVDGEEGEKRRAFVLDLVHDMIEGAVHDQIYDDANPVDSQDQLNIDQLSLEYLFNLPKTERTGRGIPKEIWDEWTKDYIETMVSLGNRAEQKIGNAAEALARKFNTVKTNKKLVEFLKSELNVWATQTQNLEEYQGIYELLKKRADDILTLDEASQMSNFQ